jgi:hypothetical protein
MHKYTQITDQKSVQPLGSGYKVLIGPLPAPKKSKLREQSDSYALDAQKRKEGRAATRAYNLRLEAHKQEQKEGESEIYNLELTRGKWMGEVRKQCRATADLLKSRSTFSFTGETLDVLYKASEKIRCCTLFGAHLHHSQAVNYKIGTALCKNRLCPNCQRVLSHTRKANFLQWFALNRKPLKKYFFYHMVLTVRHKESIGLRTGLYTSELLQFFQQLRGKDDRLGWRKTWDEYVAGGTYSTEIKPGSDASPHIHIHILLLGHRKLYKFGKEDSEFMKLVGPKWREITGDDEAQVPFLEPVYTVAGYDENGHAIKKYALSGSDVNIDAAVAECEKYTMKADAQSLEDYSDEFLRQLLSTRNRYYGRFGCLSANSPASKQFEKLGMLATDFKDLAELEKRSAEQLINPETGEIAEKDSLPVVLTPFRNVRYREVEPERHGPVEERPAVKLKSGRVLPAGKIRPLLDEPIKKLGYYAVLKMSDCAMFPPHRAHEIGRALAGTVRNEYEKENDIFPDDAVASEALSLEAIFDGPLREYQRKEIPKKLPK